MSGKAKLNSFIKALEDANILKFNKNRFNHRLKLQKYVYIANLYGLRANYDYSLYIHGPYSSELADDYYTIEDFSNEEPMQLDRRFINLVNGKTERWLELASTIIMLNKRYPTITREDLIDLAKATKPYASENELRLITLNLKRQSCLS